MGRYLLKFSKKGEIRYISHLDLLRVFQRAFRRTDIRLRYSNGFNPHPKIGFALPLSLGYESTGEYVEFETETEDTPESMMNQLNRQMPDGLQALDCRQLRETGKSSPAAAVAFASYTARFRGDGAAMGSAIEPKIASFLKQETIMNTKYSKKKKKDVETNIRPLIHSITTAGEQDFLISTMLQSGSNASLNPEILLKQLCMYCNVSFQDYEWLITRKEIYFQNQKNSLVPLSEFEG